MLLKLAFRIPVTFFTGVGVFTTYALHREFYDTPIHKELTSNLIWSLIKDENVETHLQKFEDHFPQPCKCKMNNDN